ncbi:MAG: GTP cyclohydrolase I FolE [Planctomycetota bacterium]|nr:GTP cyclohydrolase I FolE [Planctomycetota bacterium]
MDQARIERAVREILAAIGEDPERPGLRNTPGRIARMYEEVLGGSGSDPGEHLATTFKEKHREIVVLKEIPFFSMCEHHLMPFHGKAHVAYLPNGRLVGLSKLARLVDGFARRLQIQERLTSQIADTLMAKLKARGVAVLLEATHTCMTMRGVQKPGSIMVTSALRGHFITDHAARDEVWAHFYHRHEL